jgi:hypothetical protein
MRIAVIILCFVLGGCGIYGKRGKGGNVDPREPGTDPQTEIGGHKKL